MPRLRYLDDHEARRIVAELTRRVFPGSPAFQLRGGEGEAMLSSALAQPRWPHHRTLPCKAAVLHYHLNRNHPFVDGNKRFALTAAEYFLDINGALLLVGDDELYDFSIAVADGSIDRDAAIGFFTRRAVRLAWLANAPRLERWRDALSTADRAAIGDWVEADGNRFSRLLGTPTEYTGD